MEEERQAEEDEQRPADDADHVVVVAQPAERAHRPHEGDGCEDERERQPGGVRGEDRGALQDLLGASRQHQHRREDGADARRGTHRKGGPEQDARAAPPRPGQKARRDEPLGPGQESEERKPEDDEHEPGELGATVRVEDAADGCSSRAEDDEDRREAEDERNARARHSPPDSGLAEPVGLDGRHGRQVAGHERQDAGRDDRQQPSDERERKLFSGRHRAFLPGWTFAGRADEGRRETPYRMRYGVD